MNEDTSEEKEIPVKKKKNKSKKQVFKLEFVIMS